MYRNSFVYNTYWDYRERPGTSIDRKRQPVQYRPFKQAELAPARMAWLLA